MANRHIVRAAVLIDFEVDADLSAEQMHEVVKTELDEFASSSGAHGGMACDHEIRQIHPQAGDQPFTVVFFVDGDHGVEYFSEEVLASSPTSAFDLAVEKAKKAGYSTTGHGLREHEWENATEIATFSGHSLGAYSMSGHVTASLSVRETDQPHVGDKILQTINGADVEIAVSSVPDQTSKALSPGVWQVLDQYGETHLVERDGDNWLTVNPLRTDIPLTGTL